MAVKTGFTLDTSDFDKKFSQVTEKTIPKGAADGMVKKAAPQIIKDAITKEPRAPKKTGNLWRTQFIDGPIIKFRGSISVLVGFKAKYAAAVHEMPKSNTFTLDGSGPKYLESKFIKFGDKYYQMVADFIKDLGKD